VGKLFGLGGGWSYRRKTVKRKLGGSEMESIDIQADVELTG